MRLAFFASHNGSAAKAITEACLNERLPATPVLLISNNPGSAALTWAVEDQLKAYCLNEKNTGSAEALDQETARIFEEHQIDLALCSGYMKKIGSKTLQTVPVLNIHPALLPRYGGQGMYGKHVHQAVFESGAQETGATVHRVDDIYDHGPIVAQKTIPLSSGDTADTIEQKVKDAEPSFYIETLEKILDGRIQLG